MPQHTCSARIPSADIRRAAPQQPPHECTCFCLIALQLMLLLARTCSTKVLPRSGCHASVLLPQPLRLSPSDTIRCSAASCASLVRLLLRNRAPTLALISRAFYPQWLSHLCPLSCLSPCYCFHPLSSVAPSRNKRCMSPLAFAQLRPST